MLFFVTVGLEQVHANNFCINFLHHIYYAHYKKKKLKRLNLFAISGKG